MQQLVKSFGIGIASGAVTCYASILTIGYTMAIAMPQDFPIALWDAFVVFGLAATLVAFVIHLIAIRYFSVASVPALLGFAAGLALVLLALGELSLAWKAITAWLIGAAVAAVVDARLRSNK